MFEVQFAPPPPPAPPKPDNLETRVMQEEI